MCIEVIVCNISVVFLRHSVDRQTITSHSTHYKSFFPVNDLTGEKNPVFQTIIWLVLVNKIKHINQITRQRAKQQLQISNTTSITDVQSASYLLFAEQQIQHSQQLKHSFLTP